MPSATISLENQSWDEDTVTEDGGLKITRAQVVQRATGDADGTAETSFVMCYQPDGTARYVGLLRLAGSLGGKRGTLVLESTGDFDGGVASGVVTVVGGTGALAGLRGDGKFSAPKGPRATLTLDYDT